MNFESLRLDFLSYLEKTGKTEQKVDEAKPQEQAEVSIFLYSDEFKDFLVKEVGADVSIFSKSLSEIMSMELIDGKLVEPEDENVDSFEKESTDEQGGVLDNSFMIDALNEAFADENVINTLDYDKSGDLNIDEINSFYETIQTDKESGELTFDDIAQGFQSIQNGEYVPIEAEQLTESGNNVINRLLDKVYENKTVIKTLDLDGDGKLSDEEKAQFEEYIKGYDGENGELTEADIKRAFDDIMDGKFSYDNDLSKLSEELDLEAEEEIEDAQAAQTSTPQTVPANNSVGGGGGGGSVASTNSFSNSAAQAEKSIENMTLEELEAEKTTKEGEVQDARDEISAVHSGENEAVKTAEADCEKAKEAYDEAVENDENISDELKKEREENLDAISKQEDVVDGLKGNINDTEGAISDQKATVASDKSDLSALESALSALKLQTSDDPEKQAEINAKKSELETKIGKAKEKLQKDQEKLDELDAKKTELEGKLSEEETNLETLETERERIEGEIEKVCGPEVKEAMQAYNEAKDNVEKVKADELKKAESTLSSAQKELDEINAQIDVKKAEQIEKENSVSDFDFDFELNLSDRQKNELELFKKNWEENKDKYEAVEEATGMPAELIAAIHWREGSGNFDTYLHNGQKLGTTTTVVPKGIYFEDWTEAAIDAVTNYGGGLSIIEDGNLDSYYEYAERYNGLGYRNKGQPSPYVWAGTDNYTKGKYVADGQYDPNYVDQQLGVAVMLRTLLE